jgi:hypothetical protein
MTIETKLRAGLVATLLSFIILLFFFFENVRKTDEYKVIVTKQIDSLNLNIDSLNYENFNSQVQNGRYEIGLEYLKEINPKDYKKVAQFIEHKTE